MKPKKTFKGHKKVPNLKSDGLLRLLQYRYRACEHVKTFGFETPGSGHLLPGILHGAETQQRAGAFGTSSKDFELGPPALSFRSCRVFG